MLPSSKRVFNSTSQPVVFVLSRKMAPIRLSRRRGSSSRNYSIFPEIITPSPSETILTVPASFRLNLSSSRIATRGSATIFFFGVIFLPSLEIEEVMDVDFDFADFEVSVDDFVTVFLKINALGRAIFINPDDILAGKALCEMINTSGSPIEPKKTPGGSRVALNCRHPIHSRGFGPQPQLHEFEYADHQVHREMFGKYHRLNWWYLYFHG